MFLAECKNMKYWAKKKPQTKKLTILINNVKIIVANDGSHEH